MAIKSYILLGPPGSGKSSLAKFLSESLGLVHIDIGSELRRAAEANTPFAQEINETINHKKELVSDMVVYGVLADALMKVPVEKGVIVDGAPRPGSQVDEVLHILEVSGRTVSRALFIDVPVEVSIERISKRYKCEKCGKPLILGTDISESTSPCPECGSRIAQRTDDTIEGVHKRYDIFQKVTLPVVEYFESRGLLLRIDGTQGVKEIQEFVKQALQSEVNI